MSHERDRSTRLPARRDVLKLGAAGLGALGVPLTGRAGQTPGSGQGPQPPKPPPPEYVVNAARLTMED